MCTSNDPAAWTIFDHINNFLLIVDSDASGSVVHSAFRTNFDQPLGNLIAANATPIAIFDECTLTIKFAKLNCIFTHTFLCCNVQNNLLGIDFLAKFGIVFDTLKH